MRLGEAGHVIDRLVQRPARRPVEGVARGAEIGGLREQAAICATPADAFVGVPDCGIAATADVLEDLARGDSDRGVGHGAAPDEGKPVRCRVRIAARGGRQV